MVRLPTKFIQIPCVKDLRTLGLQAVSSSNCLLSVPALHISGRVSRNRRELQVTIEN
jgi:hypothetical protein